MPPSATRRARCWSGSVEGATDGWRLRLALGIAYDGAGFTGWQTQPDGRAVQDVVESALSVIADHPVATVCAGRTDAGVHALQQVVHFDTHAERPIEAWLRGTNARLPDAIAVQWAKPVPADFHARFAARSRSYRYLIRRARARHPLWRDRAGWVFRSLSVDAMREAAALLVGEHDFTAFRSSQCQAATPVRRLERIDVVERGEFVQVSLTANAFLHHMVRNIVATLVYVGDGRQPPQWVASVLASRERALAAPTFPAAGLYLTGVAYDTALDLPSWERDPLAIEPVCLA
jgi:tRNA pseudouridine38-40 synthase